MRPSFEISKKSFVATAILAYLIPVLFWSYYTVEDLPREKSWNIFLLGWLIVALGSLALFFASKFLKAEGDKTSLADDQSPITGSLPELERTKNELNLTKEAHLKAESALVQLHQKEKGFSNDISKEAEMLRRELDNSRTQSLAHLQEKEEKLLELQKIVSDQRGLIENKQALLEKLQSKMNELSHEISATLGNSVAESPLSLPPKHPQKEVFSQNDLGYISNPKEASQVLKRCLAAALQHSGAYSFNPAAGRISDVSIESYSLDKRRFYDTLGQEKTCLVMLYSLRENKVLFVNSPVKSWLGWSPDLFIQDFSSLIENGYREWTAALGNLVRRPEVEIQIPFKKISQGELLCFCHLAVIPTGVFKNHVLVVSYPC